MNYDIVPNPFSSRTELERHQRSKSFVHVWSSLSDIVHRDLCPMLSDLGVDHAVTTYRRGDRPGGRSVHRAADQAQTAGRHELRDLSDTLEGCAELISFVTPNGTGMTAMETLQPYGQEPLEAVTRVLAASPNPTDRERICNAFNLATLGRNGVQNAFISKASHDETSQYPQALAEVGVTLLFIDTMNLFSPAMAHRTLPARGVAATRQQIQSTVRNLRAELGHRPSEFLGFAPDDWLPPSVSIDELWEDSEYRAYLVVPDQYDSSRLTDRLLADDNDIRVTDDHAPVSDVRVLVTRELSDEFLRLAKTENVRWLYENAERLDAWRKEIRRECSPATDPQEEVARFLTEEVNVYDDDVLTALREVGADV